MLLRAAVYPTALFLTRYFDSAAEPPRHSGETVADSPRSDHSFGVKVCSAKACTPLFSSSANSLLINLCRVSRFLSVNSSLTSTTRKCVSELAGTLCMWLSFCTSITAMSSAACSFDCIVVCTLIVSIRCLV